MKGRIFGIYSKTGSLDEDRLLKAKQLVKENALEITNEFYDNFCQIGYAQLLKDNFQKEATPFFFDGFISNEKKFLKLMNSIENLQHYSEQEKLKLEKSINNISGEYSFVTYNKVSKILCISRDIFGTRPLYIINNGDEIVFASEIKFIKKILKEDLNINEEKIISFLCQFRKNKTETFFEGVQSLNPGTTLIFQRGSMEKLRKEIFVKAYEGTFDEAKAILRKALSNSIKNTIENPEKTAILVSGGIDSASVLKNIKHSSPKEIKTYSMNFYNENNEKISCDESRYQEDLVKDYTHKSINFYSESPFEYVDKWLERFDQPFLLPNAYLYEKTYQYLKYEDIDYIADGNGGDSVFSHGWERFGELFKFTQLHNYFSEISKFSKLHNYQEYTDANLLRKFSVALLRRNSFLDRIARFINRALNRNSKRKIIIKNKFLKKINFEDTYNFSNNFITHHEKIFNPISEAAFSALDILFFNHGIEHRSPLFNDELVKIMLGFPSKYKLNNGRSRYILRESMKSIIPDKILHRFSKSNLSENFKKNINCKDLAKIAAEIESPHEILKKYIDKKNLDIEFKNFKDSKSEATSMNIWNYYLVNRWLKKNSR